MRVEKLPEGTVTFEDISKESYTGVVDKALSKSMAKRQHDPLHGKIFYQGDDGTDQEIVFSERDLHGEFTLRPQDVVEFNIAVGMALQLLLMTTETYSHWPTYVPELIGELIK